MNENTPILVGAAVFIQKCGLDQAKGPIPLLENVCRDAAADTGRADEVLSACDVFVVPGFTTDEPVFDGLKLGRLLDPAGSFTKALGISPKRQYKTTTGGNTPQAIVNKFAEEIAQGKAEVVFIAGGEVLKSQLGRLRRGDDLSDWGDNLPAVSSDRIIGDPRSGVSEMEDAHGLDYPANTYPLIETAVRAHHQRTPEEHMRVLGDLLTGFTKTASQQENAWFPIERSAEEIITPSDENRMVGTPYTKYMNSIMQIDQGAALIMTSVGKARELGIGEEKWVYLHGCADVNEVWCVTERVDIHRSPAIRLMADKAFGMAGMSIDEMDFIDLYSCFPAVVEIACEEMEIELDDPRGLTVTGGLPYYGGAGNNYVTCSIAEMVKVLRKHPRKFGMCTGNGWFVTKHSMGIYSTTPFEGDWRREDPARYQSQIDGLEKLVLDPRPEGTGTIEAYTVVHGRGKIRMGIVVGKLENGKRFVAHVKDEDLLRHMNDEEYVGRSGTVTPGDPVNLFECH